MEENFYNACTDAIIVPVLLEMQEDYTLVNTGSSFNAICHYFIENNNIMIDTPNNGFITLASGKEKIKRIGHTKSMLTLQHGSRSVQHSFELMKLHEDVNQSKYQVVIGMDLMNQLGIFVQGLALAHHQDKNQLSVEEVDDLPVPDECPYGDVDEQTYFKEKIKNSIEKNKMLPSNAFCTVPESIVRLDTTPGATCYRRQYPIADKLMPVVDETVQKWLDDGIIVKARINNEWNSPLTLAPKKDEYDNKTKKRACLDPRHINKLLTDDRYPLPLIRDIFALLKDAEVFTTLDLKNAFHIFQIAPKDQHKTTFTHRGIQYMFQGCPFGLKPLSSKFQRVTAQILEDMPYATSFIDDIVVYSKNIQEHSEHVENVIDKLTEVNLLLNLDKCHFAQTSVHLLGFCVSKDGLFLDRRKLTNVQTWPIPKTGNDIERFLGVINYFCDHIPKISELTAPLDRLRKAKSLQGLWTVECQLSFDALKNLISCTPVIRHPRMEVPFCVATDASNTGIGAVLFQVVENKVRHLDFMARALSQSERNYSKTKRELLAIVFALSKFYKWLWGNHFTLFTDHRALTYIHTQKVANAMMINWLDTILQYSFTVAYIAGMNNILPDTLSRLFEERKRLEGGNDVLSEGELAEMNKEIIKEKKENENKRSADDAKKEMAMYSTNPLTEITANNYFTVDDKKEKNKILKMYHRHAVIYDTEHMQQPEEANRRVVVDKKEKEKILQECHAFGHSGA